MVYGGGPFRSALLECPLSHGDSRAFPRSAFRVSRRIAALVF